MVVNTSPTTVEGWADNYNADDLTAESNNRFERRSYTVFKALDELTRILEKNHDVEAEVVCGLTEVDGRRNTRYETDRNDPRGVKITSDEPEKILRLIDNELSILDEKDVLELESSTTDLEFANKDGKLWNVDIRLPVHHGTSLNRL